MRRIRIAYGVYRESVDSFSDRFALPLLMFNICMGIVVFFLTLYCLILAIRLI